MPATSGLRFSARLNETRVKIVITVEGNDYYWTVTASWHPEYSHRLAAASERGVKNSAALR